MPLGDEDDVFEDSNSQDASGGAGDGAAGQDDELEGGDDEASDAAGHADDAADDGQSDDEVDGQPARSPTRGQTRIQRLANEVKTERERNARIERELADLRRSQQQPRQMTEQEERERLALMTPEERTEYRLNKAEQGFAHRAAMIQFQTQDQLDLQNFNAALRDNPKLGRFKEDVERIFEEQKARGMFVSRDVILDNVIGRAARATAAKSGSKAAAAGAKRVAAQQVRPGNAKGDAAAQRTKAGNTAEDRLKDVYI